MGEAEVELFSNLGPARSRCSGQTARSDLPPLRNPAWWPWKAQWSTANEDLAQPLSTASVKTWFPTAQALLTRNSCIHRAKQEEHMMKLPEDTEAHSIALSKSPTEARIPNKDTYTLYTCIYIYINDHVQWGSVWGLRFFGAVGNHVCMIPGQSTWVSWTHHSAATEVLTLLLRTDS